MINKLWYISVDGRSDLLADEGEARKTVHEAVHNGQLLACHTIEDVDAEVRKMLGSPPDSLTAEEKKQLSMLLAFQARRLRLYGH